MLSSCRPRLVVALLLAALPLMLASSSPAQPAGKGESKNVSFQSYDGVELQGTFWPAASGKDNKEATVLLLHSFDPKKGGSRAQDGWDNLAARLQKEGYAVLSFDFRGFGNSKSVGKEFWKIRDNFNYARRPSAKAGNSIDHKNFNGLYYAHLVNDIAAAKAFLDERNDAGECNTSTLIVIGAGEGATLGAMWCFSEFYRRRQKDPNDKLTWPPALQEPEGRDIAAVVWLTLGTKIGSRQAPYTKWVVNVGRTNKVPTAFVYGKGDTGAANLANKHKQFIVGTTKDFKNTGTYGVPETKLAGSALLTKSLNTENWIIKDYLEPVMDKRTKKLRTSREGRKNVYYFQPPKMNLPLRPPCRNIGDEAPSVDVNYFMRP
jgi:hypothetical protein